MWSKVVFGAIEKLEYYNICQVIRRFFIMQITDVKIRKLMSGGRLRAVVSITIDDMLAVHDIKVVQGDERLFVAMPSRRDENGIFRDIVHPISPDARKIIEESILEAYERQAALMAAEDEAANAYEAAVEATYAATIESAEASDVKEAE